MSHCSPAVALGLAICLPAQAQIFPTNLPPDTPADAPTRFTAGLDIRGRINTSFYAYSSPGMRAVSMSTTACNVGTLEGIWEAAPDPDHPFICQMYCREKDGRFEQISDWSFVKHSFGSTNTTECGLSNCDRNAGWTRLGVNCSDTYGASLNASVGRLGPPWEINPFTGEWAMIGSHFDRGYPDVGYPANVDGVQNAITPSHQTEFRCGIQTSLTGDPQATYWAQCYYLHKWEPPADRENNMSSYQIAIGPSDGFASTYHIGPIRYGSVLQNYSGARLEHADNLDTTGAERDGRFYVASKVIPLADGWFRYEYAVHNRDNHGRNGTFRVPLCPNGRWRSAGFKDVDLDPLNDWTIARQGDLLVWDSPAGNAQPWNTVFNFWFESDTAPGDGAIEIVQAYPQFDAQPMLTIAADVPMHQHNAWVAAGCGTPELWPTAAATLPSPALELVLGGVGAGASCGVLLSDGLTLAPLPTACDFMVPDIGVALAATAVGTTATFPFAMPPDPGLEGADLFVQGVELSVGGALLGVANLSHVVRMRLGNNVTGCP